MNKKLVFHVIGKLLCAVSLMLIAPMIVSIIYTEQSWWSFGVTAVISLALGILLLKITKGFSRVIYAKEGFAIVSLSWITVSLIGSLPFIISKEIPSFADAFFESVSGYTTTGASILNNVEKLSHGMLFWRSFNHWIGGMGVLVFMLAFVSSITDRSIHILRAEMPGPIVGKLAPRSKDTSKVLYIIYIVLTVSQIVMLCCGDMNLFESIIHSFGTAGTGGFGIKSDSIASYSSYSQWVITAFMFIFGINFNVFYLFILKRFKAAIKSSELAVYTLITVFSIIIISFDISHLFNNLSDTIRTSAFQVVSITTTTGFSSVDFNLWPSLSKSILTVLMFIGACAGSTAGGFKMSRVVIVFKMISNEIKKMIHPRSVSTVKFEGKDVDENTQRSVTSYFAIYFVCILIIFMLISLEPFDFETNFTATVSCFNNVGPGMSAVGPMSSYAEYSVFSKILLSFAMLLGRLEIFPILIAFIPSTWRKR
ncbi:MAG: TrkH family potassium uptake protein [Ruminococcaceae bacterium]|nr:TrkH family potassium uptake protein [Oscillospiraceae bacterium]